MTSGGNLNPANADMGAWRGRMRRKSFTPTASSIDVLGTSPLAPGEVALNATVPADSSEESSERDASEQPHHGHPLPRSWCHQLTAPLPVRDDALQAIGESSDALDLSLRSQRRVGRHHWRTPARLRWPRLLLALLARTLAGRSHQWSIPPIGVRGHFDNRP